MQHQKIIWTFLDDETQQAFYDVLGKLSNAGKKLVDDEVLSKISQKGKPVVGVTQVGLEGGKIILVGTFGECSFPKSLFIT